MTQREFCQRCEVVREAPQGPGTLHLQFPLSHSRAKILSALREASIPFTDEQGALSIPATDSDLTPVLQQVAANLSELERADVRVIFQREGQLLQIQDY